jgi:hypothetical protein
MFTFFAVFGFPSASSCVDLPRLYDTLVQLLFNSSGDGNGYDIGIVGKVWSNTSVVSVQVNYPACVEMYSKA